MKLVELLKNAEGVYDRSVLTSQGKITKKYDYEWDARAQESLTLLVVGGRYETPKFCVERIS